MCAVSIMQREREAGQPSKKHLEKEKTKEKKGSKEDEKGGDEESGRAGCCEV